jgi:hypothetical protein
VTVDKAIELGLKPEVWPQSKKPDVQPNPESACDAYAASDDDPQSKSAGISFDRIDARLAVLRRRFDNIPKAAGSIFSSVAPMKRPVISMRR